MSRLSTLTLGLLAGCLLLPTVAALAAQAIPFLVSLLILLGIAKLAWPGHRRR